MAVISRNKRFNYMCAFVVILLLTPLVAMQFTESVQWKVSDFIVAGLLLFGSVMLIEVVLRKVKKTNYRIFIVISLLIALVLIWIELSVGIFGSPIAGS